MVDKDDTFFDETTAGDTAGSDLETLVDKFQKPVAAEFKTGQRVKGAILSIGKEYVFVEIGGKSEAVLPVQEISDAQTKQELKPGDTLEAFIVSMTNDVITLSRTLSARASADMGDCISAMQNRIPVQGRVTGVNKGGFNVKILGRQAFCPISQIDVKYVDDPNAYLNKTFTFVIMRITEGGRNIVVSRQPILDEQRMAALEKLIENVPQKNVYKGIVSRVVPFGLFIEVEGFEGLAHVSELAWERVENVGERFSVGQEVECVILSIEKKDPLKNTKISLSLKQVQDNPWTNITAKLAIGQPLEGTITRLASFGAFVELIPGIEGLIHVSEMSWQKRVNHPSEIVKPGDRVHVTILSINEEKKTVSCTLKDVADDPWKDIAERYHVGATVAGVIEKKMHYGYFVRLPDGISGLLPNGRIEESKKAKLAAGATIDVTVDSFDIEQRRIALSAGTVSQEQKTEDQATAAFMQQQQPKPAAAGSTDFAEKLKAAFGKKQGENE
ncbi:MAG: S1 RNA-binding domain-containing protein [Chitinivibrionales bacterium]|nr:S1 RNA-binding domain-containing protein [Chitinivibrionales bacterium]